MEETWLTGQQARKTLNISKKTLLKYLREGLFPGAYRLPSKPTRPGEWRIPQSDIEAFTNSE